MSEAEKKLERLRSEIRAGTKSAGRHDSAPARALAFVGYLSAVLDEVYGDETGSAVYLLATSREDDQ